MTTLLIFPLNILKLRYFQHRPGDKKVQLYHIMKNLNFIEYGFVSITFRKCIMTTSLKGINYYHYELVNRKRTRKTKEKMALLKTLASQIKSLLKVEFKEDSQSLVMAFDEDEEFLNNNQQTTT